MPNPDAKTRGLSWLRSAELILLLLAGLGAWLFHLRLPGQVPDEADHRSAAEHIRQNAAPGDVVLLYPWWTERARLFFPDSLNVVGYLGSDADPLPDAPRIWLYAQPSLPRSELASFLAGFGPGRTQEHAPVRFGQIEVSLYKNGRYRPTRFSAAQSLEHASVYLEQPDGQRTPCMKSGAAFHCPGVPPHVHVAAEWHEVFFQPRRCVWMHPPGGPSKLVLEFPSTSLGEELVLEAGVIWEWAVAKGPTITPVRLQVEKMSTNEPVIRLTLPTGLEGIQRAKAATAGWAAEGIRVSIQSDRPDARGTCVDLVSRQTPSGQTAEGGRLERASPF